MSNTTGFLKIAAVIMFSMATLPEAHAQATVEGTAPAAVSPFLQCAAENNITLPAKGSGQKLAADQKRVIKTCVKAAWKTAFAQCASSASFTPGEGTKPTDEQRQSIHQCMKAQGFKHHHHWAHRGQSQADPSQAPRI